jgi:TRAP-type mannitol/chloroaromatic compound transport system permease large subunit
LITALGFDPVWFGIIIVVVVELALISPPMGINVFVIKGMVPDIALSTIYKGVLPFVVAQILLLALLLIYPKLVMWLPGKAI